MSHVVPITTDDFSREVLSSELPVVVDFYADWCGPCRALAPILERMAAALEDRVRFVKIDVDEETDVAGYFQVSSIPTLLIFDRGRLVDRIVGMADLCLTSFQDRSARKSHPESGPIQSLPGDQVMKREQIIRAVAGSFVLLSLVLSQFVSPYWLWFTAFVGLNLLQSAFTRWCLLESILLRAGIPGEADRDRPLIASRSEV